MTGYLHIRDDSELPLRIAEAIWPAAAGRPTRQHIVTAENVLSILRDLSVEPAEATEPVLATPGGRSYLAHLLSLNPTRETLAGIVKLLRDDSPVAPVPVQEDRQ